MITNLHYRPDDPQPQPPTWIDEGSLRRVIAEPLHSRVNINCKAQGVPQVEVRWLRNGIPVEDLKDTFNNIKVGSGQARARQDMFSLLNTRNVECFFSVIILTVLKAFAYFELGEIKILFLPSLMKQAVLKS